MSTVVTYHAKDIRPIRDHVLIKGMEFSERLSRGGLIIPTDNGRSEGIRPRWGEVVAVGPEQKDIKPGEFVLVSHGRWTRGVTMDLDGNEVELRRVDTNDILAISDDPQIDESWGDAVGVQSDRHRIEGSLHNHAGSREE